MKTIKLINTDVRVNSKCDHPPPEFDFSNKYGQICDGEGETHCQIPNDAGEKHSQIPKYLPRTFPI